MPTPQSDPESWDLFRSRPFTVLSRAALPEMRATAEERACQAGDAWLTQGNPGDGLLVPLEGSARVRLRDERGISISHEWIYRMVWNDKRAGGDLWRSLRRRGKKYNRRGAQNAGRGVIPDRIDISERPAVVDGKSRLGDWEGDTIVGMRHRGALLTHVERKSLFTTISKLNRATAKATHSATVRRLKLLRVRAGARLRGYGRHASTMSADDYVARVVRAELADLTLSFQLRHGFRVAYVISGYLKHDPESLGYAAVIEWLNSEVATDADFNSKVITRNNITQDLTGRTSFRLPDSLQPDRTYYWHARAEDGANTGPFSPPSAFVVFTPVVFGAPQPLSPMITNCRRGRSITMTRRVGNLSSKR